MASKEKGNEGIMHQVMEGMNNPFVTMAIVLGTSQILRRVVDLNNQANVNYFRAIYIVSQLLQLGVLFALRMVISRGAMGGKVVVDVPANPLTGEKASKQTTNDRDYDLDEIWKQIKQLLMGAVFMLILHKFFGLIQPLVVQSILPWRALLCSPLFRVRVWGQKPVGSLARPFTAPPSPFGEIMKQMQEQPTSTEPASKKKAIKKMAEEESEFDVPPSISENEEESEGEVRKRK